MTNRNAYRGKLILFLVALVVLAGYQPGLTEGQDIEQLRQAAEQRHAQAQYHLGLRYDVGKGVPKDYVKTYVWLNLAAAQGNTSAAEGKDSLRKRMTSKQIAEAQKLAGELFNRIESSKSK